MMINHPKLTAVIDKYRTHPEFLGSEIKRIDQPGALDSTLLHIAARTGAIDDIEVLIAAGASVDCEGDLGNTPLHDAALVGHAGSVAKLLELGADPMAKNEYGQTPLEVAQARGHVEAAEVLTEHSR